MLSFFAGTFSQFFQNFRRAIENAAAGHKWPAGPGLDHPGLDPVACSSECLSHCAGDAVLVQILQLEKVRISQTRNQSFLISLITADLVI